MAIEAKGLEGVSDMTKLIDYASQFENEVRGFERRWQHHVDNLLNADQVIVVTGCDDSRVGVPAEPQILADGKRAVFLFVSAIGGGAPARELLEAIITNLEKIGVKK